MAAEEGAHHLQEELEARSQGHLLVVRLVAGNTGSRLRSSGSLHKRHTDLDHRSIGHTVRRSLLSCWLLEVRGLLVMRLLETGLLRTHRNLHRSSLDDHLRLVGSRSRVAGVGSL